MPVGLILTVCSVNQQNYDDDNLTGSVMLRLAPADLGADSSSRVAGWRKEPSANPLNACFRGTVVNSFPALPSARFDAKSFINRFLACHPTPPPEDIPAPEGWDCLYGFDV